MSEADVFLVADVFFSLAFIIGNYRCLTGTVSLIAFSISLVLFTLLIILLDSVCVYYSGKMYFI